MSSITSLNNSGYYQLSDPSAGAGGGAAQNNPTQALLQALSQSSGVQPTGASPADAYLLDLSPQAQQYLNGTGAGTSAGSPLDTSAGNFVLSAQQQQAIAAILAKYKDAPYTQATFDQIQNDLQAAGLDPTTLGRIDEAKSFNPTTLLIDDLNGNTTAADAMTTPDESTKQSNFIQQIISEWKTMSDNTGSTSGTSTVAPAGAMGGA